MTRSAYTAAMENALPSRARIKPHSRQLLRKQTCLSVLALDLTPRQDRRHEELFRTTISRNRRRTVRVSISAEGDIDTL